MSHLSSNRSPKLRKRGADGRTMRGNIAVTPSRGDTIFANTFLAEIRENTLCCARHEHEALALFAARVRAEERTACAEVCAALAETETALARTLAGDAASRAEERAIVAARLEQDLREREQP